MNCLDALDFEGKFILNTASAVNVGCYKIIWLIYKCALKKENDVSNMTGCFQAVRIYSIMKEIKVYIRAFIFLC